jgi:hypothetical protein
MIIASGITNLVLISQKDMRYKKKVGFYSKNLNANVALF